MAFLCKLSFEKPKRIPISAWFLKWFHGVRMIQYKVEGSRRCTIFVHFDRGPWVFSWYDHCLKPTCGCHGWALPLPEPAHFWAVQHWGGLCRFVCPGSQLLKLVQNPQACCPHHENGSCSSFLDFWRLGSFEWRSGWHYKGGTKQRNMKQKHQIKHISS